MIIGVILVAIVSALLIIGIFMARTMPLLRERHREALPRERGRLYLLEERLHATESPEAIHAPAPYPGAHATLAAARDHFALADDYKDEWHRRFPSEPAARRDEREAALTAGTATMERPHTAPPIAGQPITEPVAAATPVAEAAAAAEEQRMPPVVIIEEVMFAPAAAVSAGEPEGVMPPVVIIEEDVFEAVIVPPLPDEGEEPEAPNRAA
jgi:septal ring-binding cell division protein DamX